MKAIELKSLEKSFRSTGQNLLPAFICIFIAGSFLVLIFGGFVLGLSAWMKTFKGVLSIGLTLFLLSASPIIIGPSLRQSGIGKFIDQVNPFRGALNMIDSVVVDSRNAFFQIPHLIILILYTVVFFSA